MMDLALNRMPALLVLVHRSVKLELLLHTQCSRKAVRKSTEHRTFHSARRPLTTKIQAGATSTSPRTGRMSTSQSTSACRAGQMLSALWAKALGLGHRPGMARPTLMVTISCRAAQKTASRRSTANRLGIHLMVAQVRLTPIHGTPRPMATAHRRRKQTFEYCTLRTRPCMQL